MGITYLCVKLLIFLRLIEFNLLFENWVFFFKQKTAYEMRISDWSSDVCSSDLREKRRTGWDLPTQQRWVASSQAPLRAIALALQCWLVRCFVRHSPATSRPPPLAVRGRLPSAPLVPLSAAPLRRFPPVHALPFPLPRPDSALPLFSPLLPLSCL